MHHFCSNVDMGKIDMSVCRLLLVLAAMCSMLSACAGNQRYLSTEEAAGDALVDPATWMPLALAGIIGLSGVDDDISDWASKKNPVFGSKSQARTASDQLQNGLITAMLASSVVAPASGGAVEVGRRTGANVLAFGAANGAVQGLKVSTARRRPDDTDRLSFPSGHAVAGFTAAHLIDQNADHAALPPALKGVRRAALMSLATATAWARVEGQKHFAADVLVSAALGNFFAKASFGRLVRPTAPDVVPVSVDIEDDEITLRLRLPLP
jgi:membrane-associated phospholipid phosphatase